MFFTFIVEVQSRGFSRTGNETNTLSERTPTAYLKATERV